MGCRICAALGVEDADLVEDERMILSADLAATHLVSFLPLVQHLRYSSRTFPLTLAYV
jgi:hypothetical protein